MTTDALPAQKRAARRHFQAADTAQNLAGIIEQHAAQLGVMEQRRVVI